MNDLFETTQKVRILADAPGDHRFRQSVADSVDKLAEKVVALQIESVRIKGDVVSRLDIAKIIATETAALQTEVEFLGKCVWGLVGAFGISFVGGVVGILITKAFK